MLKHQWMIREWPTRDCLLVKKDAIIHVTELVADYTVDPCTDPIHKSKCHIQASVKKHMYNKTTGW